jgi:hypothetical protein
VDPPDLDEVVLCHVRRQNVLKQDLVDAPHGVDALLLAAQLGLPEELCARRHLHLAVEQVQQAQEKEHQEGHGRAEWPRSGKEEEGYTAGIRLHGKICNNVEHTKYATVDRSLKTYFF